MLKKLATVQYLTISGKEHETYFSTKQHQA